MPDMDGNNEAKRYHADIAQKTEGVYCNDIITQV